MNIEVLRRLKERKQPKSRPGPGRLLGTDEDSFPPVIVHCHLKWDGVWQRPQQFLSRLSRWHRILFIEGPELVDGETNPTPTATLSPVADYPNITVMKTYFPRERFPEGKWVDSQRRRLLKEALRTDLKGQFKKPVQWFYDPMAVTAFAGRLNERAIVYDCMDQLSQFKFAPPELVTREQELLAKADLVFAGGRKLHQAKSRWNSNCHFYGCGVDVEHFSQARLEKTEIPEDAQRLRKPILGFFGVVDERMDYELVEQMALAHPEWNLVIIGPVVKVDPKSLPQLPNIHWLGRREYAELPRYGKAFDVCLMPFALNEATEYINPTKALEYMAMARPIVSSAVPDVVANFSEAVLVSKSQSDFIRLCETALSQPDRAKVEAGLAMAQNNTWEAIVAKLESHLQEVLTQKNLQPVTPRPKPRVLTHWFESEALPYPPQVAN